MACVRAHRFFYKKISKMFCNMTINNYICSVIKNRTDISYYYKLIVIELKSELKSFLRLLF